MTRVVFDLSEETLPVLRQASNGVVVSFGGAREAAPVAVAAAAPAAPAAEGQFGRQPNTRLRASPSNTQPCASIA